MFSINTPARGALFSSSRGQKLSDRFIARAKGADMATPDNWGGYLHPPTGTMFGGPESDDIIFGGIEEMSSGISSLPFAERALEEELESESVVGTVGVSRMSDIESMFDFGQPSPEHVPLIDRDPRAHDLSLFNKKALQGICRRNGLQANGLKMDLIERILNFEKENNVKTTPSRSTLEDLFKGL